MIVLVYQDDAGLEQAVQLPERCCNRIINKLRPTARLHPADSVGLGKTFTALAVIKYYELRNRSVLVLCLKKLADNWPQLQPQSQN